MTNYNDGLIHGWNGGECPVHPESEVMTWLRGGFTDRGMADDFTWEHEEVYGSGDIIAFQVIKEHREPREIWFNEYENGLGVCYRSTQEEIDLVAAEEGALEHRIKCVRFREVIE